jgi:GNAT superfamily N-acetyltransferase
MVIRPVELGDIMSLRDNCFSATPVGEVRLRVESDRQEAAAGRAVSLVAVDDAGEVVGNLTVTRLQHRLQRHRAKIGGFVIHPRARGSGLARSLIGAAVEWARGQGCSVLEISCRGGTHAEDAYKGLGFVEWGRLPGGFVEEAGTFDQVDLFMIAT